MAVAVETLLVKLEARITDFERNLARAQRSANTASARIGSTFGKLNKTIGSGLALVGIGLGVRALTGFITETIKAGEAIGDTAEKLGISAEAFQELSFAADQSGTSMEAVQKGITQTAKFLGEVERGTQAASLELKNLGLSLDDLKGKSPDEAFEILLDRIGKISDPLKRNAELLKVFGKQGVELGQLASLGAKGIDDLRAAAQRLGLVISDETIGKMQEAGDKIGVIQAAAKVAGANMSEAFLPAIDALAKLVTSPEFQAGLTNLAGFFGNIVKFLADHPDVLQALALAAGAAKFFGSGVGAAVGLGSMLLPSQAGPATETIINDQGQRVPIGSVKPNQGTVLRPPESPFSQFFDTTPQGSLAGGQLAAKVAKLNNDTADSAALLTAATEAQQKKYEELAASIQLETDNLTKSAREQEIANDVAKLGTEATQQQKDAIAALAAAHYDLALATQHTIERMDLLRDIAKDALSTFISDLREGKTAAEALGDVLNNIATKLLDFATNQLINSLFGGAGTAGGGLLGALLTGRQGGGPVNAGQAYRVGEAGPELFVPNVSGRIMPHGAGAAETHTVELLLSPEIDARIKRVSGPQSQRISFNIVRANNALTARSRELQG